MDITSYLIGKKSSGGGGGDDITKYFDTSPTDLGTSKNSRYFPDLYFVKKCPDIIIPNEITNLDSAWNGCKWTVAPKFIFGNNVTRTEMMFYQCEYLDKIDTSGFDMSNVTTASSMFSGCTNPDLVINTAGLGNCSKLKNIKNMFYNCRFSSLDLKNFYSGATYIDARTMFNGCSNLEFLDMRSFDFTQISQSGNMFTSVPTDCLIVVKDTTQKEWFTTKFPDLTNVKTVAEYNAM